MDAIKLLEFAQQLFQVHDNDQAKLKTVISRAYYATFHSSKWLDSNTQNHGNLEDLGAHRQLSKKFSDYPPNNNLDRLDASVARSIKSVGYLLATLHASRLQADYDINETTTINEADAAIKLAIKIIDKLNSIQNDIETNAAK